MIKLAVPLLELGLLDVLDVLEEDAPHRDALGLLVVVLVVGAVAGLFPFRVALLRAGGLTISRGTSPQAAQIAWLGWWLRGFPQMHLRSARGSIIM